jgi:hypothetical protein
MAAADPIAALVALLLADASVAALVGTRGFGGELPAGETGSMPRKAFVLRGSGGVPLTGASFVEHDAQRIDLFAFGETPREAEKVRAACALALRRARRQLVSGVLIHWVNPAGGFSQGREPETEWPRSFQSFQCFHALEAAA